MKSTMTDKDQAVISAFHQLLTAVTKQEILEKAAEAMDGRLVLNGTGPVPYFAGKPPKWNENPFGVPGYTWTISRLVYMTTLCKAYLITGENSYMEKVVLDLDDWFKETPAPPAATDHDSAMVYHGINHWRMLEVGFRPVYTFPILLPVLRKYGVSEELMERLLFNIHQHGERIYAGSRFLWPTRDHNHYLLEMVGLIGVAALNPEDEKAKLWAEYGISEVEYCCMKQISEDGSQIEGCATYHNDCMDHFCMAVFFAGQMGMEFSPAALAQIKKGIDFSLYTLRPDGIGITMGDSDPDLLAVDSIVYGFLLFGEAGWIHAIRNVVPENIIHESILKAWGYPNVDKLLEILKKPAEKTEPFPLSTYQKEIQQYYTRTSWGKEALSLAFICKTPVHYGNHGHIDPLGFDFYAYGKPLLTDPGRFTYKDGEDRHTFKSTQFHNTPTIGGRDAFPYVSTFVYGEQKQGGIIKISESQHIKCVSGYHDNYEPARLSRVIGILEERFLLIADTFSHAEGKEAKIFFHLNSASVKIRDNMVTTTDEGTNIQLFSTIGAVELLPGRLADMFYHAYPSQRACYTENITKDSFTAITIAVPTTENTPAVVEGILLLPEEKTVQFHLEGKEYLVSYAKDRFTIL